jgi:hypothetical protein
MMPISQQQKRVFAAAGAFQRYLSEKKELYLLVLKKGVKKDHFRVLKFL